MRLKLPSSETTRAFTMIEMMIVVIIIGIMTAMIIPEMKGTFEDALLRSTARDLVNTLELASSRAVSLNQDLRVQVSATENRYLIERRVRRDRQDEFAPLKDVIGSAGDLDKRITVQIDRPDEEALNESDENALSPRSPPQAIAFYPDGTADAAIILLQDRAGFRLALRINPITSRVTVLEMARE